MSSDYTTSVAFAVCLVTYLLTGIVTLGAFALAMIPAFVLATAVSGGTRAWEQTQPAAEVVAAQCMSERSSAVVKDGGPHGNVDSQASSWRNLVTPGLLIAGSWIVPELVRKLVRYLPSRR